MKPIIISFIFLAMFFSCHNSEKQTSTKANDKIAYDMYIPSEMSKLMNDMYAYNFNVKKAIINEEPLTEFPIFFLKIHSAELSRSKSRNETFESFSKLFIEKEKDIFNKNSEIPIEQRYNAAINMCISCHETECRGPIRRIKKLLIQ